MNERFEPGGHMDQFAWSAPVAKLRAMLDALDSRARPEELPRSGLTELKSALDELRLRAWGLLSAAHADDPHAFQERFRTHRGTEMCRALSTDLRTGRLSSRQPDLPLLGDAAGDLATAVKKATRKPAKRRGKGSP
jgi:hypothetical protein